MSDTVIRPSADIDTETQAWLTQLAKEELSGMSPETGPSHEPS